MVTGGNVRGVRLFHLGPGNSYKSAEDQLRRQTGIFVVGQKGRALPKCSITPEINYVYGALDHHLRDFTLGEITSIPT